MRRKRTVKATGKPRPVNRADGKIKRWNKISDIPLDDEDQFHASRDKILLEGDDLSEDPDGDEDEVFALQGLSEDDGEEEEQEEDNNDKDVDAAADFRARPTKMKKVSNGNAKRKPAFLSSSSESESHSEEETWGRQKSAYYFSNAADIESDDEEGHELEVQEAKRLQAKSRETLMDSDFGLDDPVYIAEDEDDAADEKDALPPSQIPSSDKKSVIWGLENDDSEPQAIARDWEATARNIADCQQQIIRFQGKKARASTLDLIHLRYQALLTYATTLAFYLHLSSCDKFSQNPELLKAHPISSRLLTLKMHLATLEELDLITDSVDSEDDAEMDHKNRIDDRDEISIDGHEVNQDSKENGGVGPIKQLKPILSRDPKPRPSAREEKPPKKKRKTALTAAETTLPAFDLVEPVFTPAGSSSSHPNSSITDPYGEPTSLQYADAADKKARRKTLRFHTSKIESASARRQGARTHAAGGDDDLPYRERRRERETRLARETKRTTARGQDGADLDDVGPDAGDKESAPRTDENGAADDGQDSDGYYELVKRQSREKKEQKKAQYEAAHTLLHDLTDENVSGPRAVTRTILANKGLMSRRPKSARNPRVKKREKFEKAKKKLASQKAIYKGGIGDTGKYDGERTGISKVIKSISLT